MEKRTLYALLAKPVRRWEFLLGKFGGLLLTLTVNTAAMAAGLFLVLRLGKLSSDPLEGPVLVAVYFILLKLALVVAVALLFSCYTTPLLSILCTAGLYVAGLFVSQMRNYHSDTISPAMQTVLRWISYLLPNFENFDVMAAAAHGRAIPAVLIAQNTAYAALYCAIILTAAAAIFTKRNLK
jgi:ABC-type transport system involved in multi-copper enzyme maturation permease subunit